MDSDSVGGIKIPTEKLGLKQNFNVESDIFREIVRKKKKNGYQRQFLNIKRNMIRRII